MRAVLLFLGLAAAGLALIAALGGGFLADGPGAEAPAVGPPREEASADRPRLDLSELDPKRRVGSLALEEARRSGTAITEHRTWVDRVSGERIEFPRFVVATFQAGESTPVRDPLTGEQGIVCRDIRVRMFREPATREEAETLRARPDTYAALVKYEVEGEEGRADFLLPPAGAAREDPENVRLLVHLTKAVRITDVSEGMVIRGSDITLDPKAGTATGSAPIVADLPAGRMTGRGIRIDGQRDVLEILADARLDLESLDNVSMSDSPFDLGGGARATRVRAEGGAVATREPTPRGEAPRFTVRLERRVHVEQDGGHSLDADEVEIQVVRRDAGPEAGGGARGPANGAALSSGYRLRQMTALGNVVMVDPRPAPEGGEPGLLSLAARRLVYVVLPQGRGGTSVLEGDPRLEWIGAFSPTGARAGSAGRGKVVARCRERMSFGPSGPDLLAVVLQSGAVVEHEDFSRPGEPDRIEAERLDLFLKRAAATRRRKTGSEQPFEVVAFTAAQSVRLSGPSISGEAELVKGENLDRLEERHVWAMGPGTNFAFSGLGAFGADAPRERAAPAAMSAEPAGPPAKARPRRSWVLESLQASRDVRGKIHSLSAIADGEEALGLEGDALVYRRLDGSRLTGEAGRPARVTLPGSVGRPSWLAAPTIAFRADGVVETDGATHAEVWTGGPDARGPAPAAARKADVLAVRSGSRIDVIGVRRPDADLLVRLVDGGSIEVRSKAAVLDRLEAGTIEIGLAERATDGGPSSPFGLPSAIARPAAARPPSATADEPKPKAGRRGKAEEKFTLLALDCARRLAIDPRGAGAGAGGAFGGVRSLVAEGNVVARNDAQRLVGETLSFDGATGVARLVGAERRPARVSLGEGDLTQRFVAPAVEFVLKAGTPERIEFAAPVWAVLHREASADDPAPGAPPAAASASAAGTKKTGKKKDTERYELMVEGRLVVEGRGATAETRVAVRRTVRKAGSTTFGDPAVLRTPRLVLEALPGGSLLAQGGAPSGFSRMVAEGEGTRFDVGEQGKNAGTALGDRIVFDAATSLVSISGTPFCYWRSEGGASGDVLIQAKGYTFDLKTGLPDLEGSRVEFGR